MSRQIAFKNQRGRSHQRLLMARRSGYLSPRYSIPAGAPEASAEWRRISKHLSRDAARAGFADPRQWLYQGAWNGGVLPGQGRPDTKTPPLIDTWSQIILTYGTKIRALMGA